MEFSKASKPFKLKTMVWSHEHVRLSDAQLGHPVKGKVLGSDLLDFGLFRPKYL